MNLAILKKYLIGNYDFDMPDRPEFIENYDSVTENMWLFAENKKEGNELEKAIREILTNQGFLIVQNIDFYFSQDEDEIRKILKRALEIRKLKKTN